MHRGPAGATVRIFGAMLVLRQPLIENWKRQCPARSDTPFMNEAGPVAGRHSSGDQAMN